MVPPPESGDVRSALDVLTVPSSPLYPTYKSFQVPLLRESGGWRAGRLEALGRGAAERAHQSRSTTLCWS